MYPTSSEKLPDTAWIFALARVPGIGHKTLLGLLNAFGSGQALWQAALDPHEPFPHLRANTLIALRASVHATDPAALWATFSRTYPDIHVISHADSAFPSLLRQIPDAPALLYVRGAFEWHASRPLITIVGTRRPSTYGRQIVQDFARQLSQAGFGVISGLAFGIDSLAHQATLESGGQTLAVIGSGVDDASISPQSHLELAHRIFAHGGALISELAPGHQGRCPHLSLAQSHHGWYEPGHFGD
jgi:DNA processing protein